MICRSTAAVVPLIVAAHSAQAICSVPMVPICATHYCAFDDQEEFKRYRSLVRSYQSQARDYLDCTKRKTDNAIDEHNRAIEIFNRRARG